MKAWLLLCRKEYRELGFDWRIWVRRTCPPFTDAPDMWPRLSWKSPWVRRLSAVISGSAIWQIDVWTLTLFRWRWWPSQRYWESLPFACTGQMRSLWMGWCLDQRYAVPVISACRVNCQTVSQVVASCCDCASASSWTSTPRCQTQPKLHLFQRVQEWLREASA